MKLSIYSFLFVLFAINMGCAQTPEVRPQVLNPKFDKKISQLISFSVPTIGPEELEKMGDDIYIFDAREQEEYDVSHIPNAQYIGYNNFDKKSLQELDKEKTVIVYCSIGYRSEKIGEQFQKQGFQNVYNLYGSIFEWMNQGYPVVDKDGNPTQKVHTYNKNWSKWVDENLVEKVW